MRKKERRRREKQTRRDRRALLEAAKASYRTYQFKLESFGYHDGTLVHAVGRDMRWLPGSVNNARHPVWETVCGQILCVGEKARFSWTKKAVTCLTCVAGPRTGFDQFSAFQEIGIAMGNTRAISKLEFPWDGTSKPVTS